jgi:alpha-D-xyloside xylohydrolase
MSGILFWSFDIGGFAGPLPSIDLYRRSRKGKNKGSKIA